MQAKANADAIAGGLGRVVGAIISLQVSARSVVSAGVAPGMTTSIQKGLIEVRGTVVLEAEMN